MHWKEIGSDKTRQHTLRHSVVLDRRSPRVLKERFPQPLHLVTGVGIVLVPYRTGYEQALEKVRVAFFGPSLPPAGSTALEAWRVHQGCRLADQQRAPTFLQRADGHISPLIRAPFPAQQRPQFQSLGFCPRLPKLLLGHSPDFW